MREIKFRGFHPDENGKEKVFINGEWIKGFWVYGYYVKAKYHWHKYGIHEDFIIVSCFQNGGYFNVCQRYSVIPETVGQYTGLSDKNGTRIFEGDICKNIKTGKIVSVRWHGTFAGYCWSKKRDRNEYLYDFGELFRVNDYYEVIGNIFDNPELVSGV